VPEDAVQGEEIAIRLLDVPGILAPSRVLQQRLRNADVVGRNRVAVD
jgi:ribosome biogenesis GTPase A